MDRFPLVEEYRLIERSESEVNGAWKGAHILLFFLAFVFGSFCTFCFHMLMYLFDEKCVLFPKLLSLSALRHNIIYEFIPADKDITDNLPVDFLSTQWVDQSACYLPTYVPLVSGIFGLVWTTMFLMCSSGSRTQTGLQRPWRVLPPVFIFSLVMGGICVYASVTTHNGLQELCVKLGEITGSFSCTYTINVATLAYERRIRGVYQATQLTILSAWLHTMCWLLSALLTLARVLLAVDFQLIRVRVELRCDIDRMLEQHEQHLHTVSPEVWINEENEQNIPETTDNDSISVFYRNKEYDTESEKLVEPRRSESEVLYFAEHYEGLSDLSLVPCERFKLGRLLAYQSVPKDKQFIVNIVYDLVETINLPETESNSDIVDIERDTLHIDRQNANEKITSTIPYQQKLKPRVKTVSVSKREIEETAKEIRLKLQEKAKQIEKFSVNKHSSSRNKLGSKVPDSSLKISSDSKKTVKSNGARAQSKSKVAKKSNLKHMGIQTDTTAKKKDGAQKVHISESKTSHVYKAETSNVSKESLQEQETQTSRKEKQD